jgi:penicillin-binding protein-related factor A (putative recombinase)
MKKLLKSISPGFIFSILFFAALATVLFVAVANSDKGYEKERQNAAANALRNAVISCYAIEGMYPPNVQYMKDNYGLSIDEELFIIHYIPNAENRMPDFEIVPKFR